MHGLNACSELTLGGVSSAVIALAGELSANQLRWWVNTAEQPESAAALAKPRCRRPLSSFL